LLVGAKAPIRPGADARSEAEQVRVDAEGGGGQDVAGLVESSGALAWGVWLTVEQHVDRTIRAVELIVEDAEEVGEVVFRLGLDQHFPFFVLVDQLGVESSQQVVCERLRFVRRWS